MQELTVNVYVHVKASFCRKHKLVNKVLKLTKNNLLHVGAVLVWFTIDYSIVLLAAD